MTRPNPIAVGLSTLVVATFLAPSCAFAVNFYLETNIFPSYGSSNADSNDGHLTALGGNFASSPVNTKSGFEYDLRNTAGFKFWNWAMIGFTYNYLHNPKNADASAGNLSWAELTKKYEYGPSIGYIGTHFRFVFTYFLAGRETYSLYEYDTTGALQSGENLTNYLHNGYQFVLGYGFNITQNIQLGPSLAYRHVAYDKQDSANAGTPSDPGTNYTGKSFTFDAVEASLTPMISFIFQF